MKSFLKYVVVMIALSESLSVWGTITPDSELSAFQKPLVLEENSLLEKIEIDDQLQRLQSNIEMISKELIKAEEERIENLRGTGSQVLEFNAFIKRKNQELEKARQLLKDFEKKSEASKPFILLIGSKDIPQEPKKGNFLPSSRKTSNPPILPINLNKSPNYLLTTGFTATGAVAGGTLGYKLLTPWVRGKISKTVFFKSLSVSRKNLLIKKIVPLLCTTFPALIGSFFMYKSAYIIVK